MTVHDNVFHPPHITKCHFLIALWTLKKPLTYHASSSHTTILPFSLEFSLHTMKVSRVYSFQRDQFIKFHRKTRVTSSVTLGNVQRRAPLGCFPPSCILRQVLYKLKNRLKQALVWKRTSPQYTYDFRSYSLNFDDGLSNEHMPPRFC